MNLDAIQLNANAGPESPRIMGQSDQPQGELPSNPFVGLRPFESAESILFFGRDKQIVELLQQLHRTRFLAVVGSSGCGKSSLIRAGLIPKLKAGFLVERRERWNVITLKPGDSPLRNLASVLLGAGDKEPATEDVAALVKKMRVEGAEAVVSHLTAQLEESNANLLLLVDQFEEIFRFVLSDEPNVRQESAGVDSTERDEAVAAAAGKERRSDEAARFVSIILELSRQRSLPIYVVMTMRSDFISDYDIFTGLPEAVNGNLYLVPRLNRQQYQDAVKGPIRLYGRDITPRLLDRVCNDLSVESDQLPVMQHALMRTWENWSNRGDKEMLDLPQYEAVGTLKNALSWDADLAMRELKENEPEVAERLFQALVDTDTHGRRVRRPVHLSEVQKITGAPPEKILGVIEHFRRDGRCFLMLSSERIEDDPLIDISHESFIRQWDELRAWVDAESESKEIYTRVVDAALRREAGMGRLWGADDPDLQVALDWWKRREPNEAWARRYHPAFQLAEKFLKESEERRKSDEAERERKRLEELEGEKIRRQNARLRRFTFALVVISMLAAASAVAAGYAFRQAKKNELLATEEGKKARTANDRLKEVAINLEKSADDLKKSLEEAKKAKDEAQRRKDEAQQQTELAEKQKHIAEERAAEALKAKADLKIANAGNEKALNDARRELLGKLGGLYQLAISQAGNEETWNEAAQNYEKILDIYHRDNVRAGEVSTLLVLAKLYRDSTKGDNKDAARVKKAIEYYERALALIDPNISAETNEAINALISMGDMSADPNGMKDSAKAAQSYERAIELGYKSSVGDNREVYRNLGDFYGASQKPADIRKAIGYYELDVADLDTKIAASKENPDVDENLRWSKIITLIHLVTLNRRIGQNDKAKVWHDSAINLARTPQNELIILVKIVVSFNLPGEKETRAEYIAQAAKKLEADFKDPAATAYAYYEFGRMLIQGKAFQESILFLRRAEEIYHGLTAARMKEANTILLLGSAYQDMGMKEEAIANYRRALKIFEEIDDAGNVSELNGIIKRLEAQK